jgi:hypothetical protein
MESLWLRFPRDPYPEPVEGCSSKTRNRKPLSFDKLRMRLAGRLAIRDRAYSGPSWHKACLLFRTQSDRKAAHLNKGGA